MKTNIPTEHQEQSIVIHYCRVKKILAFSIPNGTYLNGATKQRAMQINKLKREGLKVGVPDLFIPMATKDHHGLFIEMKRTKGSTTSTEQKAWVETLNNEGYKAVICKGSKVAIEEIERYFNS